MEKREPNFDRVTHFIVTTVAKGQMMCSYNDATDWMVMAIAEDGTTEFANSTDADNDLETCLKNCFEDCPQARDKVGFKSMENGEELYIEPAHPDELVAVLMEYVSDDTPDDVPNTDDHPLEEVRTALDEAAMATAVKP